MRRILRTLLRLPFKIAFTPYLIWVGLRIAYEQKEIWSISDPCFNGKMIDLKIKLFILKCQQADRWIDLILMGLTLCLYIVLLDEFWDDNNTNQEPV